jgi:hypothetical protein
MNVRRTLLWMLAACLVVGESRFARAAEPAPPASPPRFLFIVEKSAATAALGLDLPQTLFDLVYRGANGHLPYGGVFEIWVFGEETIIRGFTPQMLLPNNRLQLARMASAYVRTASSGGEVAVGKMVEHLLGATEMAQELTVFLLTAPGTRLSGTPRDAELNLIFDTNAEAQRVAGRPFITAIRIQDGLLAATSVSDSPFTMTVPPMPPTRMTPQQREALIAETRRLREEREKPPVVPKAVPVAEPAPQLAERNLPEAEPKAVDTVKPETVVSEPAAGAVAAEPVIVAAGAATPPVATPPQVVAEAVAPEPATVPAREPDPEPPVVSRPASAPVAVTAPLRELELPSRTTTAGSDGPVILQFQEAAAIAVSPEKTPPPEVKTVATPPPVREVVAEPRAEPVSQPAPVPAARPATTAPERPPTTLAPRPDSSSAGEAKDRAPSAIEAVSAPTWFTAGGLFVAGIFFFGVAVVLTWVLVRRARSATGPSYITRSIDDRRG